MRYIKTSFVAIILTLVLMSCDNTINNPTITNSIGEYYPLSIGNYWIYETQYYTVYNQPVPGALFIDSVVAVQKIHRDIYDGFLLLKYRDGKIIDSIYVSISYNRVYRIYNSLDSLVPNIEDRWLNILSQEETNSLWNVTYHAETNLEFTGNGITYKDSGAVNTSAGYNVTATISPTNYTFDTLNVSSLLVTFKKDIFYKADTVKKIIYTDP